mgnify:CR=1 FL=1
MFSLFFKMAKIYLRHFFIASQGKELDDYASLLDQFLNVGTFHRLRIVGIVYDEAIL